MSALSQIQAFIKRKTQVLPRLMTLHGKIEMAKKTLELKKLHKAKKQIVHAEPLTYIDADEADDVEMDSEDSQEEIEQIPISQTKRKHFDNEDESGLELDDSVSDDDSKSEPDYDDESAEEEAGIVDVADSDDELEDGKKMRRLADESSSGDDEMEEYDESSEQ